MIVRLVRADGTVIGGDLRSVTVHELGGITFHVLTGQTVHALSIYSPTGAVFIDGVPVDGWENLCETTSPRGLNAFAQQIVDWLDEEGGS